MQEIIKQCSEQSLVRVFWERVGLKCRKEFGHQQSWTPLNIAIIMIIAEA